MEAFRHRPVNYTEQALQTNCRRVGWLINWDANGIRLNKAETGSEQSTKFTIEIRDIRYEK